MRLTSWLAYLCRGRRLARRNNRTLRSARTHRTRQPRPVTAEVLEDRTLLSVTTLLIDGELSVVSDNGESVAIGADLFSNVEVTVNGVVDTNVGPFAASSIQSMIVEGDDLDNVLDLSGVLSADYTWTDIDGNGAFDLYVSNMFSNAGSRIVPFAEGQAQEVKDALVAAATGNNLFLNPSQISNNEFLFPDGTALVLNGLFQRDVLDF